MMAPVRQPCCLLCSLQGRYGGFQPEKLPAVPGLEGALYRPEHNNNHSPFNSRDFYAGALDSAKQLYKLDLR